MLYPPHDSDIRAQEKEQIHWPIYAKCHQICILRNSTQEIKKCREAMVIVWIREGNADLCLRNILFMHLMQWSIGMRALWRQHGFSLLVVHIWNYCHALLQKIDGKDGQVMCADDGFLASGKFWLQGDLAYLILLKEYKKVLAHRWNCNLEEKQNESDD